jgi:hypothetical protein
MIEKYMFEYAISEGEGTLIDYGVFDDWMLTGVIDRMSPEESLTISRCTDDCETGK